MQFGLIACMLGAMSFFWSSRLAGIRAPFDPRREGQAFGLSLAGFFWIAVGIGLVVYHFLVFRRQDYRDDDGRQE
ncbi:MAG TPA: hypothetical protein VGX76_24145 [Pirellulales bacterium]|nr:hypothetical protein [Pirellulales bacterium]